MGAICGIIANKNRETLFESLSAMLDPMRFRGSGDCETEIEDGIALGMLAHKTNQGGKAGVVKNETGSIICIAEGELYNYNEIAEFLHKKGHQLSGASQWDIIPHLYEEKNLDFPKTLNGAFVIAIYDKNTNSILLARDHLGSHCGFWYESNGCFCFSTTTKSLVNSGLFEARLDPSAVNMYFAFTCPFHPRTMFDGVRTLRPGHVLLRRDDQITEHEYWPLGNSVEDHDTSEEEFQLQIKELCLDAIRIRYTDDSDLGAVLSGGVDTGLITAIVSNQFSESNPLNVFSIGYHEHEYDDSPLQDLMLRKYPLKNHKAFMTEEKVLTIIQKLISNFDYPLNNASSMGTYLCMETANKEGVRTIFEGEAADELFCGGGGVVGENLVQLLEKIPYVIRKNTCGILGRSLNLDQTGKLASIKRLCYRTVMPSFDRMLTWLPAYDRDMRYQLLSNGLHDVITKEDELAQARSYLEKAGLKDGVNLYQYGACKTYLCDDLLYKNERIAAANGIINRTPFIDYRLAELAFRIPAKMKIKGYISNRVEKKWIYRKAIQGLIPDEILWRRKTRGFSQPTSLWMKKGVVREYVEDVLFGKQTKERGVWKPAFVRRLFDEHVSGAVDRDRLIWSLLIFELWCREHIDR